MAKPFSVVAFIAVLVSIGADQPPKKQNDKKPDGFTVPIDSWNDIVAGMDEEQKTLRDLYHDNQIKANARWKADNESLKKTIVGKPVHWDLLVTEISPTKVIAVVKQEKSSHEFVVGIPVGSGSGMIRKAEADKLTARTDTVAIKGRIKSAGFDSGEDFQWSCFVGEIDVDRAKK
jgi:hypothetical protein